MNYISALFNAPLKIRNRWNYAPDTEEHVSAGLDDTERPVSEGDTGEGDTSEDDDTEYQSLEGSSSDEQAPNDSDNNSGPGASSQSGSDSPNDPNDSNEEDERDPWKKALIVGINYWTDPRNILHGCVNDVSNMYALLVEHYDYQPEDIVVLIDEHSSGIDSRSKTGRPYARNIIRYLVEMVRGARAGDRFFFHFSGHGGLVPDEDGDEVDGYDEAIFPIDSQTAGCIVDDDLYVIATSIPHGATFTAVVDSCHSGSVFDLPFSHDIRDKMNDEEGAGSSHSKPAFRNMPSESGSESNENVPKVYHDLEFLPEIPRPPMGKFRKPPGRDKGLVVLLSGCRKVETSGDTGDGGVLTSTLLDIVKNQDEEKELTYEELYKHLLAVMHSDAETQIPELSSSHPLNASETPFCL